MSDLSFQEKSTIASLLATFVVGVWYSLALMSLPGGGLGVPVSVLGYTVGAVVLIVVIEIVLLVAIAIATRDVTSSEDERDRLVKQRAASAAGWFLSFGVVTTIGQILVTDAFTPNGADPMVTAFLLMATFVLSELLRFSLQLFFYRRGV